MVDDASGGGSMRRERILVLGLGNEILRDDGVGLLAARRVAERASGRADLFEACVATVDLLPIFRGYDRVVVIDAYLSREHPPGTTVRATPQDLPRGFGYRSFHTLPFREMLDLGRMVGWPMPRDVTIHGLTIEDAACFGSTLTPRVAASWKSWADDIARTEFGELQGLQAEGDDGQTRDRDDAAGEGVAPALQGSHGDLP